MSEESIPFGSGSWATLLLVLLTSGCSSEHSRQAEVSLIVERTVSRNGRVISTVRDPASGEAFRVSVRLQNCRFLASNLREGRPLSFVVDEYADGKSGERTRQLNMNSLRSRYCGSIPGAGNGSREIGT